MQPRARRPPGGVDGSLGGLSSMMRQRVRRVDFDGVGANVRSRMSSAGSSAQMPYSTGSRSQTSARQPPVTSQLVEQSESSSKWDETWDQIDDYLSSLYRDIASGDLQDHRLWISLSIAFFGTITFYLAIKWLFGSMAMVVNILLAIFLIQNMRGRSYKKTVVPNNEAPETILIDEPIDYRHEFDYPIDGKPSRFRSRSRPFIGRKKPQYSDSVDSDSGSDDKQPSPHSDR